MTRRQLPLPFDPTPRYEGQAFLDDESNAEALAWLERAADWPQGRLALWGEAGAGKSHLLHRWASRRGGELRAGPGLRFVPPTVPLAIDDADAAPEAALLHSLNAAAEAGLPVLLAARTPPARWNVALPDLASRLRAITAIAIRPPGEALLRALFTRLLADRQLAVPEPVRDWLLLRLPRTADSMREAAARLDRAALAAGRRVSRPLAAAVLAELTPEADHEDLAHAPSGLSPAPAPLL